MGIPAGSNEIEVMEQFFIEAYGCRKVEAPQRPLSGGGDARAASGGVVGSDWSATTSFSVPPGQDATSVALESDGGGVGSLRAEPSLSRFTGHGKDDEEA